MYIQGHNSVCKRMMACNNLEVDLIIDNVYTNLVKVCPFILKILTKNQILTSIKSCNSLANLRKMMFYHPNTDHVNNVYTNLGVILSSYFQIIEQKPNPDINQGP